MTETLFPRVDAAGVANGGVAIPHFEWQEDWGISEKEMAEAVKRMESRNVELGPDGIPGKAVYLAYRVMEDRIRGLITRCLREGVFPERWRRANLVFLRKEGKPENLPSSYRPICLLDEMGKLLERVIVQRIHDYLEEHGPNLHAR